MDMKINARQIGDVTIVDIKGGLLWEKRARGCATW